MPSFKVQCCALKSGNTQQLTHAAIAVLCFNITPSPHGHSIFCYHFMNFFQDIKKGYERKRLWKRLAVLELKSRYQGAVIGSFWIVLTLILKVFMLSLVYTMVLDKDFKNYVMFLAIGILTWNFISAVIVSSGMVFKKATNFMLEMRLPQSTFVFQNLYREVISLIMYQLFAIPLVIFLKGWSFVSVVWLWALLGYVLIVLNAFFVNFWLGWLATRFRDIQPMLISVIMVIFLVTPILWPPPPEYANSLYFQLNPIYHLLELIRAPILHNQVPVMSLQVGVGLLAFNFLICVIFYPKVENKLVYWL